MYSVVMRPYYLGLSRPCKVCEVAFRANETGESSRRLQICKQVISKCKVDPHSK
jgi:hypothetical protein